MSVQLERETNQVVGNEGLLLLRVDGGKIGWQRCRLAPILGIEEGGAVGGGVGSSIALLSKKSARYGAIRALSQIGRRGTSYLEVAEIVDRVERPISRARKLNRSRWSYNGTM